MKLIIDIDKELKSAVYRYGLFLNPTEKTSLIDAINNGTPIPDNATNGDVMKMMFPNIENQMIDLVMRCSTSVKRIGNDTWMNLPYQKGGK